MAYADKCFYFDWGNRLIKLQDFDDYGSISLRKRWDYDEDNQSYACVSVELWGKEKDNGERYDDKEIVLTRDNAMILATKLMRAVAELDADDYRENALHLLHDIEQLHYKELDKLWDKRHGLGIEPDADKKGGLGGALNNFLDTPMGKDALKETKGE